MAADKVSFANDGKGKHQSVTAYLSFDFGDGEGVEFYSYGKDEEEAGKLLLEKVLKARLMLSAWLAGNLFPVEE